MGRSTTRRLPKLYVETSSLTADHVSGVGHVLLEILKVWKRRPSTAFEVVLVTPFDLRPRLEAMGFDMPIKSLPMSNKVFRLLRKYDALPPLDLWTGRGFFLFSNYWNSPLAFSKSATYFHDIVYKRTPEYVEPRNRAFLTRNAPSWLGRTDLIVTVSESTRRDIGHYYPWAKSKAAVVPNGVDLGRFSRLPDKAINRVKKKYGVSGDYFLFVGNIEPRKNLEGIIGGYRLLPKEVRDMYGLVMIGGDGWNNASIKQAIRQAQSDGLNIQKVNQYVADEDLRAFYMGAIALVHPAFYEGFGVTLLEAMASGTPVITADNSSLSEIVGDAGLYADPNDEQDISDKMYALASNAELRQTYVNKGYSQAAQYTWERSARMLEQKLKELL